MRNLFRRNFQNILLLLGLVTLQGSLVQGAKKSRASDFFPKGSGVILNYKPSQFEEEIQKKSDQLVFLYVFDSEQQKSQQMNDQIMKPILEELKNYCQWYAYDCHEPEVKDSKKFKMCENEDHTPFLQLFKPPEMKLNPYTNQPMKMQAVQYTEGQITVPSLKTFILNNLPDYSFKIDSLQKLEEFRDLKQDQEVNKVILFSKKKATAPIYKALTAYYRDKLRFGFVSSETEKVMAEYKDTIKDKLPSIVVLQSFDMDKNITLENQTATLYQKKDIKFDELKEFFGKYARFNKIEVPQRASDSAKAEEPKTKSEEKKERKNKAYYELYDYRQFNSKILESDKAGLVFYITSQNISTDVKHFDRILKLANGPLNVGVFYVNHSAENYKEIKDKFKLGGKYPQLRFYKNNLFGEDKNSKSYEIYLNSKFEQIQEEIHDAIGHEIKEVSEKIFNNLAISSATEEKKNVIVYFYNDDKIGLNFKALSAVKYLHDDFTFMSVYDPSEEMLKAFQIQKLPAVAGILKAEPDSTQARQFTYGGPLIYQDMLQNLLKLENKEDDYNQKQKLQSKARDRKFEEITNQYKFQQNCLDKQKGCAIAFLSGNNQQEYETQNHKEYLETLEQLEKDAKALPLYYMWINASCHSYLLEKFEINPMFIPTVIFYLPEKDKSAHLIGKFDKETIQKHESKFVNGKLSTFPMKVKADDIQIQDLDCPNIQLDIGTEASFETDQGLEDEILKEILEEEKERESQRKSEKKTKKKKDKKDKKEKKSKSSKAKEDL
ncbi:UNKNOWN [Stylonychia lemnae]|uniref:Thioredoxin domain-containing protein n=1 Tax=Stylonychia lemnae TaxID=5949 RepID=A0A078ATZ2_STYLE|nr:UNKNOWN [Stylonychia lemnae]|eukprot:CDW85441.1 UNKNOWN [Stylonychia lemnae]